MKPAESIHERWLTLDGYRLRYLYCDAGEGSGTQRMPPPRVAPGGQVECSRAPRVPVLLIHGLLGYSFSWRYNMSALARPAPVYAIDLPGVGFSDRPARLDRSFRGLAEVVLRSLDSLGIATTDVVGTSHGGAVAMMLAVTAPHRVRRLVLVAPVHPWSDHGRWQTRLLASPPGRAAFRRFYPCLASLNRYFLRRMYGDPRRIVAGTLESYSIPVRVPGTREHLLGVIRTWNADLEKLERALPRLAGIPVLLVWGSRDLAVPAGSAEALQQRLTAAELVIMGGVGHLPYEEAPDEFNRVVGEFLAR